MKGREIRKGKGRRSERKNERGKRENSLVHITVNSNNTRTIDRYTDSERDGSTQTHSYKPFQILFPYNVEE